MTEIIGQELQSMDKVVAEFAKYAELEGSEWGSTARMLLDMWYNRSLCSMELQTILEEEIRDWLDDVVANATIIEREMHSRAYTVQELEWNN